jgi:lipopolysaccharide biosynthesis regulator YciM
MYTLLLIILFLALSALILNWRKARSRRKNKQPILSKDYFVGLNYLLNEQPDKAVDIFIRLLEVDSDTLEMHLALGNLFRRRGEVDRAIRIHQNIIARPNLTRDVRLEALLALGEDYLAAGVYDRAERLFQESIETNSKYKFSALKCLLDIYEREKDWKAALLTAQQLEKTGAADLNKAIAHYYCELIEDPRFPLSHELKMDYLKLAQQSDHDCIRANLIKARLAEQSGDDKEALKIYKRVFKQSPSFIMQCLPAMQSIYLMDYLYECLVQYPHPLIIDAIATKLSETHGVQAGIDFWAEQLQKTPSLTGVKKLLSLQMSLLPDAQKKNFSLMSDALKQLTENNVHYQCEHCGFSGKKLHWLCPGCRRWETMQYLME